MGIDAQIEKIYKDMSGSIAKNRLTIQLSFAIQLIVDLYSVEEFTIFMDCIEDIAVKTVDNEQEKLFMYQVKTKKNGEFSLNYIINQKWFEKLYKHTNEFIGVDYEMALVSNVDVKEGQIIFPNERTKIDEEIVEKKDAKENEKRLYRIKKCISDNERIPIEEVDLSRFYFIKSNLHCDTHKEQALKKFEEFIIGIDKNAELIKTKAFFTALYDTLDSRFNNEINPETTDIVEIVRKKGYTKGEFKDSLTAYLNESIPKNSELYSLLNITSIAEQKEIAAQRPQFLMDLTKRDEPFKILWDEVLDYIRNNDTQTLIKNSVDFVYQNKKISPIYKNQGYIKFATAFIYYKYINVVIYE